MGDSLKGQLARFEAVFQQYLDVYMKGRNLKKLDEMVSENFSGFGTGMDENFYSKARGMEIFQRDIQSAPNELRHNIHRHEIKLMDQSNAIATTELDLKTTIADQEIKLNNLRLLLLMHEEAGIIKITGMHISFPTEVHDEGESYPLKELEERNKVLKRMVDEKTKRQQEIIYQLQEAKDALREKTRFLNNIIDTTSDLVAVTDMEGNYKFIGPSHSVLGYDPDLLVGRNVMEFVHPDDYQETANAFAEFLAKREDGRKVEYRYRRADGDYLWFETVGKFILDDAGNPKEILFSSRDFTARKQAEAKILYLQKSESLGRMSGAVAHHFNNQLSVVMGNLEMVLDDLPGDTKNRKSLLQAMKAAQKATDVSRQILNYLGPISGTHIPVNLSDICRKSLSLLQSAVPKGMTVNVEFPDSGPFVRADAGQIQQVLTNLFTNAQESIFDNQGSIDLCINTVSHKDIPPSNRFPLDWQPQDIPYACLKISDTGCGIAHKDIEKLFDPFFTKKFTGRGLGLSVLMGIMKAHGGCITVDSEPKCGSVFRVYLPVSAEKNVDHEKQRLR